MIVLICIDVCCLVKVERREMAAVLSEGSSDSLFVSTRGEVVQLQEAIHTLGECIAQARQSARREKQQLLEDAFGLVRESIEAAEKQNGLVSIEAFTEIIHRTLRGSYEPDDDKSYIRALLQVM